MLIPSFPDLSITVWTIAFVASVVLGISKSGIKGIEIISVTLMALAFGARESTGLLVPLLVLGDLFAVYFYNRHARWSYIVRFLPWMLLGLLIGVFTGKDLPENIFKIGMAIIIIGSAALMFWWDQKKSESVPRHWAFAGFMGTLAGITTMIGNLAGAFANIFFLAMRLPKNEFIGTAAWLFLIVNVCKLPLHIFIWETITPESLWVNLALIPGVLIGIFLGIRMVKIIKERFYRKLILVLTAIGALMILWR